MPKRTQIVDKNGKVTHVYKNDGVTNARGGRLGAIGSAAPPKSAAFYQASSDTEPVWKSEQARLDAEMLAREEAQYSGVGGFFRRMGEGIADAADSVTWGVRDTARRVRRGAPEAYENSMGGLDRAIDKLLD